MQTNSIQQHHISALLTLLICVLGIVLCSYYNVDMTGRPYDEIAAYRAQHPEKSVTYSVTIEGDTPVTLKDRSTKTELTASHVESLLDQADYLQGLTSISFPGQTLPAATMHLLTTAFPNADITCDKISFLGNAYDYNATQVDLSHITGDHIHQAAEGLLALPMVQAVELCDGDNLSTLSLEDANALYNLCPHLEYHYRISLFGQVLTTDMERVEYFKETIKDEGLEPFKLLLPMMHKLTYFKLDWCKTSDEAMDALRTEYRDRFKVVWRIFFGGDYNALTDTYKLWANGYGITNNSMKSVKYCNEVRYLDFGHTRITSCDWARYMPNLEVCILGDTNMMSIAPLAECKNLTFLELFLTWVKDLSPLAELTQLQYLNISDMHSEINDITPIYELDNLLHVNAVLNYSLPQAQAETFKELHPDCISHFELYGGCTTFNWRHDVNGHKVPRYALLREQIGYDDWDYSRYPNGYLTQEVTYESTGITPPEAYVALMERLAAEA